MHFCKRVLELVIGVAMAMFLIARYSDKTHAGKWVIACITDNPALQIIIAIAVLVTSANLIAGEPKDYSRPFYKLIVRILGDPGRRSKE